MKVLVLNGSPRMQCTDRALQEIESVLAKNGIETVRFNLGTQAVTGCNQSAIVCQNQDICCSLDYPLCKLNTLNKTAFLADQRSN